MKKFSLLCLIGLLSANCFSQIPGILPGSGSIAQTSVSDTQNQAAFNNPAILGYAEKPEAGLQFENHISFRNSQPKPFRFNCQPNS